MTEPRPAPAPLAGAVLRGALVMVLLRFAVRAIGLVSITVTARLLTPADFGVVGSASIVVGLFAVLQANGVFDYVVRKPTLGPDDLATAWTVNLGFNTLIAAGLALSARPAAGLLGEPALVSVLPLMALIPLVTALASPASVMFMREMRFAREFRLRVVQKVLNVACLITGSLLLRSYLGLIYGILAGTILFALWSYLAYPFRPRLVLRDIRPFLGFTGWTLLLSLASYLALFADEIVVRRNVPTELFGLYHVSRDLSRTLVAELVAPAAAALLPGLARLQGDRGRFSAAAVQAVGVAVIVAAAAGLGVSATAPEVTTLLLGAQWTGAAPFLAWLAVGVAGQTLAGLHRSILLAIGRPQDSAFLWLLRAAVLLAAAALAVGTWGAIGVAIAFAVASVLLTAFDYAVIFTRLGRPWALPRLLLRPLLAGAAMLGALALLPLPADLPAAAAAAIKVPAGATVYGLVLGLAWWLAGRPQGPETALLNRMPGPLGRVVARIVPRRPPHPG